MIAQGGEFPVSCLFFAGVAALIVVLAVVAHLVAAERRKALTAWAAAHGLTFLDQRWRDMDDRLAEFDALRRGSNRYAYNIIQGSWFGRGFLSFDYHYVTGSGKNRQTHRFSAVVLGSHVALRPLLIRPEGFGDRIAEFFGFDDIDFESAEFSRQFYVKSPDRKWAYDVLHPRAMEFLLASPRFSMQFGRQCVMAWNNRQLQAQDIEAAAEVLRGLLDGLPGYLMQQQMQSV